MAFTYHLPARDEKTGHWPAYAWPGGYPIVYVTRDTGNLCVECANNNLELTLDKNNEDWCIVAYFINFEAGDDNTCSNCRKELEIAYPED